MKCRIAQQQIALLVGHDLSQSAVFATQQHLAECAECRQAYADLQDTTEALAVFNSETALERRGSLWSKVRERLPAEPVSPLPATRWSRFFSGSLAPCAVAVTVFVVVGILPGLFFDPSPDVPLVGREGDVHVLPANMTPHYLEPSWRRLESVNHHGEELRIVSY